MAFTPFMHERNIYKNPPDFAKLAVDFPEFQKYIIADAKGHKVRVDFSNTEALRMLTKILLKKDFNLDIEIPEGFLIPTVPQRLNYILWLEDLLTNISQNQSKKEVVRGIDIGTGACAIFAVLGAQKNGWKFIATESSENAITWAKKNIEKNNLNENISVIKVNEGGSSLDEVLSTNTDCFHFCMCNPPFFENSEEIRKKNLHSNETIADVAQKDEIFVKGGELDFVRNILKDSLVYKNRVSFFTSMFGKKKSFLQILKELKEIPDAKFTSTEFCQGNTIRWGIAWTFDQSVQFELKSKKRPKKSKKTKPPLEYEISINNPKIFKLDTLVQRTKVYLQNLEIHFTVVRTSQNFTELLLKSDKNTWTHQRRKRRELERQKKDKKSDAAFTTVPTNESVKTHTKEENLITEYLRSMGAHAISPENQEDNIHDESQSSASLLNTNKFEHTDNSLLLQNSKRKLDLDLEDPVSCKKAKIGDNENSESIPAEQNILSEGSVEKSSALISEDQTVSICNVNIHSVLVPDSLVSPDDTGDFLPSKSEVNNHKNTETEPEGLVLYSYLHFIKGKNKVYVKMNCPPSADRNTMYQVFQLIKNKIN